MELKWRKTYYDSWQLFWDERNMRCAELSQRSGWWSLALSWRVVPLDFTHDRSSFDTLEEAKEYTENLVRLLIIGGHHERN